jgi:CDP-diacylglycerol--glycerol-3-phosphate 3-phosphatidyltransferase
MVVVILTRELLVSAVRTESESGGKAFGASWIGKLKMVIQSATICVVLGQLAFQLDSLAPLRIVCVWLTVIITALSAVSYVHRARDMLLTSSALGGTPPPEPAPPAEPGNDA